MKEGRFPDVIAFILNIVTVGTSATDKYRIELFLLFSNISFINLKLPLIIKSALNASIKSKITFFGSLFVGQSVFMLGNVSLTKNNPFENKNMAKISKNINRM